MLLLLKESRYQETRDPFFRVNKQDIFTQNPNPSSRLQGRMMHIGSKKALINMNTYDVVGLVSPHYRVVSNIELAIIVMNAIKQLNIHVLSHMDHLNHSTSKWKRWYVLGTEGRFPIVGEDTIIIMLEIFNSYDAKAAYGCRLLGYRLISDTGLFTREENIFKDRFIHYADNTDEFAGILRLKMEAFQETISIWKEWTEVEFTLEDLQTFINSRSYMLPRIKKDIIENYTDILRRQRFSDTKWGAFNALCYMAMRMTKAAWRNGRTSSNIFGNLYKTLERVCKDMYGTNMGNVQTEDETLDRLFDDI